MLELNKFGFKLGDRFEVLGGEDFTKGDIVFLSRDDGSDMPEFTSETERFNHGARKVLFAEYANLKKIDVRMRSEAERQYEARRALKRVPFTIVANREKEPELAKKLEQNKGNPNFRQALAEWIISRW
jgi:hypothetical protein